MYNRIKYIRKTLKLSQEEFGKKIGLAQNSYSAIETGTNTLTEQNIKIICFTFGVNEQWLRTGQGEIFISINLSEEKEILEIFRQLSPEVQNLFLDYGHVLLKNEKVLRGESPFAPNAESQSARVDAKSERKKAI